MSKPLPAGVILVPPGEGRQYPCGPMHSRAGALNVFIPGGFEANTPSIVEWFRTHP